LYIAENGVEDLPSTNFSLDKPFDIRAPLKVAAVIVLLFPRLAMSVLPPALIVLFAGIDTSFLQV
jgi:hypothetical protein